MRGDGPSATAGVIALSTVFLRSDPRWGHLVPAEAAEASRWFLEAAEGPPRLLVRAMPRRWFRRLVRAAERLTIPGILRHYALRKRYLEEAVRTSLHEGFAQVVILGAGYDTLPLRLHQEFPQVLFIAVDHPATQRAKRRALERRALPGANLRFLPADFARERLEDGLSASPGFRAEEKILFAAEGVLMYLPRGEVNGLFDVLGELGGTRGRFAFTVMEPGADGRIAFRNGSRLVTLWLRWRGEPSQWGLRPEQFPTFLAARGFFPRDLVTPAALRDRYLGGPQAAEVPLAEGECACVADRGEPEPPPPA